MTRLTVLLASGTDSRFEELTALATRVQGQLGTPVAIAYADRAWPTLTAALGRALDGGPVDEVVVVPMFLHAGYPATVDLPASVARARLEHDIPIRVTAPLQPDLSLLPALDRLAPAGRPVVLVPEDTRDGAVRARLDALAQAWSAERRTPVAVGYPVSAPTAATQTTRLTQGRRRPVTVSFTVPALAKAPELATLVAQRATEAPVTSSPVSIGSAPQWRGARP